MAETKLQEALTKLGDLAADFSSLEVLTYTGDIEAVLKPDKQGIDWDGLFTRATGTQAQGTLKLVAATRVLFDGDVQNFQTQEKLERLDELLRLHDQSVQSGRSARTALIQYFADNLKALVPKFQK
ncbi:hypothetical protein JGU66_35115 [Myxococcaceae bacterium JPH2]|nr:hypothetical protein [Myxococcaceae bacterium JPH2]